MNDLTSDYTAVKARPSCFIHGRMIRWHHIGRYSILEHNPFGVGKKSTVPRDEVHFHVYVDEESRNTSFSSLDSALVAAIAIGNLEINHARHMTTACLKVLELNP